jgi:hypothetical protein
MAAVDWSELFRTPPKKISELQPGKIGLLVQPSGSEMQWRSNHRKITIQFEVLKYLVDNPKRCLSIRAFAFAYEMRMVNDSNALREYYENILH